MIAAEGFEMIRKTKKVKIIKSVPSECICICGHYEADKKHKAEKFIATESSVVRILICNQNKCSCPHFQTTPFLKNPTIDVEFEERIRIA